MLDVQTIHTFNIFLIIVACSSLAISKDELLRQLQEKVVSCKDVTFRILGLSLTSINIILSIIFIITLTKVYNNYEKNKQ